MGEPGEAAAAIAEVRAQLARDPGSPALLAELGRLCWLRYIDVVSEGRTDLLDESWRAGVAALQAAREALPRDGPERIDLTWSLGLMWSDRYTATGDPFCVERAVPLVEEVAAAAELVDEASVRYQLGSLLLQRYGYAGVAGDLDRAIDELESGLRVSTGDETWRDSAVIACGLARAERWRAAKRRADLDAAIGHLTGLGEQGGDAVLGAALLADVALLLNERAGLVAKTDGSEAAMEDRRAAVRWATTAVEQVAPDDPRRARLRLNAAVIRWRHYARTRQRAELADLERLTSDIGEAFPEGSEEHAVAVGLRGLVLAERLRIDPSSVTPNDQVELERYVTRMAEEHRRMIEGGGSP